MSQTFRVINVTSSRVSCGKMPLHIKFLPRIEKIGNKNLGQDRRQNRELENEPQFSRYEGKETIG
jgi:hypothetical protein